MSDIGPEENRTSEADSEANEDVQPTTAPAAPARDRETRQWAMFIHFSILAGWAIPIAGLIVPILLWQIKKDELPGIVPHAHASRLVVGVRGAVRASGPNNHNNASFQGPDG